MSLILTDPKLRIAIVNSQKCKPKKCKQECKKNCPINKTVIENQQNGKICIEVDKNSKICYISQILCSGCGICVKKCPFQAITIINLPRDMRQQQTHRYGPNTFKLHRLPVPRVGQVLGLVGTNGIGKSTALQILSGKLKPNLGYYDNPPDWKQILNYFKGSQLQNYFTKILQDNLKAKIKVQYVDSIPKKTEGLVGNLIKAQDKHNLMDSFLEQLQLGHLLQRNIKQLSGGQLQRLAILMVCISQFPILMFDEPSSYLDVKQRIKVAKVIRNQVKHNNYVICVQHDLAVLDFLSDFICCLYGKPTAYGIVTMPYSVRQGINVFLAGFIPTQNMRFRQYQISFKINDNLEQLKTNTVGAYSYQKMYKKLGTFELTIQEGKFQTSQIVVMLGQNGTGKSTFIKMLAGRDKQCIDQIPKMDVSWKPQNIAPKFEGTVLQLLQSKVKGLFLHPQFQSDVAKPLRLQQILENQVQQLSGGQLQRVAIILALCKPANVYLLDQPSAYLDSQQRIQASRIIKRYILNTKKAAFVVQHDFIMSTYLADQVIVFEGQPGKKCHANSPQSLVDGMNKFLNILNVTFRRDPYNFRPRINKLDSIKDKQQKKQGNYFCLQE